MSLYLLFILSDIAVGLLLMHDSIEQIFVGM